MKASVNYVGNSSMIIGIRVEISNRAIKHCNSSYFHDGFKDRKKNEKSSGLILSNLEEVRFTIA
jgi:acyl-CoA hydrolase